MGALPPGVLSLDQQAHRAWEQVQAQPDDLAKNVCLEQLHDRNEVLYHRLLTEHLKDLLPIVYDPTVGEAIIPGAPLLPQVENMRASSATVAVAVARRAAQDGVTAPRWTTSSSRCGTPCGSRSTHDGPPVPPPRPCTRCRRWLLGPAPRP